MRSWVIDLSSINWPLPSSVFSRAHIFQHICEGAGIFSISKRLCRLFNFLFIQSYFKHILELSVFRFFMRWDPTQILFLQKKPRILPLVAGAHFLDLCEQHVQPARENDSRPCHSAVSSSQFQILCIPPVHGKGVLLMACRGSPLRPYKCKLVEPMVTYLEFWL